jgi:hypothetical protein
MTNLQTESSNVLTPQDDQRYTRIAALLIIAVTLFRFWYCRQMELVGDEAYYWFCSRRLDLSYFDKGPGAAATIALGTKLFGQTVFGVRFFAVMLSMATGIALFYLARMLFSTRVAFTALIFALLAPMFAVGSILMTIDPLSVFFWTAAAILFWKAAEGGGLLYWLGTGALVGLGLLAKYTNLMELVCFILFCAWDPRSRRHFLRPHFYLMILAALLFSLPVFIWNSQHQWITVEHLLHRGSLDSHWRFKPEEVLVFLGQQAGVISPLIFLGILGAAFIPGLSRTESATKTRYLLSLFLPLFLMYVGISLNKAGQPNWTAPAYVSGMILLAARWDVMKQKFPKIKCLAPWAIGVAALETVVLHNTYLLHLPQGRDPMDRAHGFAPIAQRAAQLASEQGTRFFVSNNYQNASLLAFYLPEKPETYQPRSSHIENQFSIWPGYREKFSGGDALYVSDNPRLTTEMQEDFSEISLLEEEYSFYRDRRLKKYYFFLCRGLRSAASSHS